MSLEGGGEGGVTRVQTQRIVTVVDYVTATLNNYVTTFVVK